MPNFVEFVYDGKKQSLNLDTVTQILFPYVFPWSGIKADDYAIFVNFFYDPECSMDGYNIYNFKTRDEARELYNLLTGNKKNISESSCERHEFVICTERHHRIALCCKCGFESDCTTKPILEEEIGELNRKISKIKSYLDQFENMHAFSSKEAKDRQLKESFKGIKNVIEGYE